MKPQKMGLRGKVEIKLGEKFRVDRFDPFGYDYLQILASRRLAF